MSLSHWGIWPGWWTQGFVHGAYASTSIPVWKPVSFEEFCATWQKRGQKNKLPVLIRQRRRVLRFAWVCSGRLAIRINETD